MIKQVQYKEPIAGNVRAMNPKIFMMWLIMVSIFMIFIALSSAYIVNRADGGWPALTLPDMFIWSTVIIVLSSVSMHWAYIAAKKNELVQNRIALVLTVLLGAGFIYSQIMAFSELINEQNAYFVGGHVASSFIYALTGIHILHLVSGAIFLVVMLIASLRYRVHSKSLTKMEMCTTYWHFLGGLWLYLYLFLTFYN